MHALHEGAVVLFHQELVSQQSVMGFSRPKANGKCVLVNNSGGFRVNQLINFVQYQRDENEVAAGL